MPSPSNGEREAHAEADGEDEQRTGTRVYAVL